MAEPYVRATRYVVNLLPDADEHGHVFELTVEWRGNDRWAVLNGHWCLGSDGDWDYEMRPPERADDWISTHRFDLDTALRLAKKAAPEVTVNGLTAAAALDRLIKSGRLKHVGGNAEDCPACQAQGFDMLSYPWTCPGPETQRCPAKHGALGRICELPTGHPGLHTGSGANGSAVWDGDAP